MGCGGKKSPSASLTFRGEQLQVLVLEWEDVCEGSEMGHWLSLTPYSLPFLAGSPHHTYPHSVVSERGGVVRGVCFRELHRKGGKGLRWRLGSSVGLGGEPKEEWKTPTSQISALRLGHQPWAVCLPSSPSHLAGFHPGHPLLYPVTTAWDRLMVVLGLREPWGKTGCQGAGGGGGRWKRNEERGTWQREVRSPEGAGAVRGKHRLESQSLGFAHGFPTE